MPTYDYVCGACGHALEIHHSITAAPKRKCPRCKQPKLARRIGAGAGFLFKGPGFHKTDYRSESYKAGAKADSGGASPAAAGTGTGGEAQPAVEPKSAPEPNAKPAADSKAKTQERD